MHEKSDFTLGLIYILAFYLFLIDLVMAIAK